MKAKRKTATTSMLVSLSIVAVFAPSSRGDASVGGATPDLVVSIVGGPNFTVEQSNPTDPNIVSIPAGNRDPLVIHGTLTNTGASAFVGIPGSTLFRRAPSDPFFLSGVTGIVDGNTVNEGDGLTDIAAVPSFIGGFILNPGETKEFVFHVIYGLLCNGCANLPGPVLEPAPCGETLTLLDSFLDIRSGEIVAGVVVSDPDVVPDIRLFADGPFPLTVTVDCGVAIQVIDIKPGSDPNSISPGSRGSIPVAILSTADFDALSDVMIPLLTFGRTGNEQSLSGCGQGGEDVNGDGLADLVCHFFTNLTGFQVGDIEGILKGETISGTPIVGSDSVRIVGRQ